MPVAAGSIATEDVAGTTDTDSTFAVSVGGIAGEGVGTTDVHSIITVRVSGVAAEGIARTADGDTAAVGSRRDNIAAYRIVVGGEDTMDTVVIAASDGVAAQGIAVGVYKPDAAAGARDRIVLDGVITQRRRVTSTNVDGSVVTTDGTPSCKGEVLDGYALHRGRDDYSVAGVQPRQGIVCSIQRYVTSLYLYSFIYVSVQGAGLGSVVPGAYKGAIPACGIVIDLIRPGLGRDAKGYSYHDG